MSAPPNVGTCISAERISDHRRLYLEYEGPVSGGRGMVKRWDAGSFTWRLDQADIVRVDLNGKRLQGEAELRAAGEQWSIIFKQRADSAKP
jgi:hypothetical protein